MVADSDHRRRAELESFIKARFARAYGVRALRHYPRVTGLCAGDGTVLAVPARPGREIADRGRHAEAAALLTQVRAKGK